MLFISLHKKCWVLEEFQISQLFSQYFEKLAAISHSRSRSQMLGTEFLIPVPVPVWPKVIPAHAWHRSNFFSMKNGKEKAPSIFNGPWNLWNNKIYIYFYFIEYISKYLKSICGPFFTIEPFLDLQNGKSFIIRNNKLLSCGLQNYHKWVFEFLQN